MRKIVIFAAIASIAAYMLAGCAQLTIARNKAVTVVCKNKAAIAAVAIANGDTATLKAIDAYCPEPEAVPSTSASEGAN